MAGLGPDSLCFGLTEERGDGDLDPVRTPAGVGSRTAAVLSMWAQGSAWCPAHSRSAQHIVGAHVCSQEWRLSALLDARSF